MVDDTMTSEDATERAILEQFSIRDLAPPEPDRLADLVDQVGRGRPITGPGGDWKQSIAEGLDYYLEHRDGR